MAYQDGETRVVNGVTYQRQGGVWRKQGALDQSGNPIRFRGVQTPKGAANTVEAQNNAAASIYAPRQAEVGIENTQSTITDRAQDNAREETRLDADLLSRGLRRGANGLEQIPGWQPAPSADVAARRQGEEKRAGTIRTLLDETRGLYEKNIKGQPASRLFGLTEFIDRLPANQEFSASAANILPLIRPLVAQTAKEGDSDKEMEIFMSYIPTNDDNDQTIERKFKSLEILIDGMIGGKSPSQVVSGGGSKADPIKQGLAKLEQRLSEVLPNYPKSQQDAIRKDAYRRFNADPRIVNLKNAPRKGASGWKIERIGD